MPFSPDRRVSFLSENRPRNQERFGADLYLIDKNVLDLTAPMAALIAFLSLTVSWLAYEGLCRSPLGNHEAQRQRGHARAVRRGRPGRRPRRRAGERAAR